MLQQTQVDTVIPYFRRFLDAFPSVQRLARARLERVFEIWSGLGYYRRARHLHLAAQKIVRDCGGVFPSTYGEARLLPGVGDYTARAVLSIAHHQPYAIVDGNVARVVSRLRRLRGNLHRRDFRLAVTAELEQIFSRRQPGAFNQAIMELGQSVCLPRSPRCGVCPLRQFCAAYRCGDPEAHPEPRPRRATETRYLATAIVRSASRCGPGSGSMRDAKVALTLGLEEGLLADLWNFPAAFGGSRAAALGRLRARLQGMLGGAINWDGRSAVPRSVARLTHKITYRAIQVDVYSAQVSGKGREDSVRWFTLSHLPQSAVSSLARKVAEKVVACGPYTDR